MTTKPSFSQTKDWRREIHWHIFVTRTEWVHVYQEPLIAMGPETAMELVIPSWASLFVTLYNIATDMQISGAN